MTPSSAKAKGRALQQKIRDYLLFLCKGKLEKDDIKSTGMGQSGEDIQLSPAARKLIPLSIECKSRHKIAVYPWYEQAVANCPKNCEPVVVIKQDRKDPLVLCNAGYFFEKIINPT